MDKEYNTLSQLLGGAIEAMATRPQKSTVNTSTQTITSPYALDDMLARREKIGLATKALDEALKEREGFGYNMASALSGIPQQQGYGTWLGDFARAFGAGFSGATNARTDRALKRYNNEMKDLETILKFDKEMGSSQNSVQSQKIGYDDMPYAAGGKSGSGNGSNTQTMPVLNPAYWEQMIENFDEGRPTEASYRNMSQFRRNLRNKVMTMGSPEESYARDQFAAAKGREFLPLARNALKGAGQITDFEDKKYTEWLNAVKDPVQLKDTAVRIVDDVATKNGWSSEQKAKGFELLGLTSTPNNLLEQQKVSEPERVKTQGTGIDALLEKFGAKRVTE